MRPGRVEDRRVEMTVAIELYGRNGEAHTVVSASACLLACDGSVWALDRGGRRRLLRREPVGAALPFTPVDLAAHGEVAGIRLRPDPTSLQMLTLSAVVGEGERRRLRLVRRTDCLDVCGAGRCTRHRRGPSDALLVSETGEPGLEALLSVYAGSGGETQSGVRPAA